MLSTGEPGLPAILPMDPWIAPLDGPGRGVRAAGTRAGVRIRYPSQRDHERCPAGSPPSDASVPAPLFVAAGASAVGGGVGAGRDSTIAPGRSTLPRSPALPTLASTTAKYGRTTAPIAKKSCHQPCAKRRQITHSSRMLMAMEYLIARERRSALGDGGREVSVSRDFTALQAYVPRGGGRPGGPHPPMCCVGRL